MSRRFCEACDRAVREAQTARIDPAALSLGLREMFALQPRLEHPRGRRALRVLEHPRFRAAYDLLLLRAQAGLASQERVDWWTAAAGSLSRGARGDAPLRSRGRAAPGRPARGAVRAGDAGRAARPYEGER